MESERAREREREREREGGGVARRTMQTIPRIKRLSDATQLDCLPTGFRPSERGQTDRQTAGPAGQFVCLLVA